MPFTRALVSIGSLAALLVAASPAGAQECKVAADCGKGFQCVLVPVPQPVTAHAPACAPDTNCPIVDPAPAIDAGTTTTGYCSEASCATDADCGATMVCLRESHQECTPGTASGCAANTKCDPPPSTPPSCVTKSSATCTYKWQLPCSTDAECGDGFTCAPSVSGECSGGVGVGHADAGVTNASTGIGAAPSGSTAPAPSPSVPEIPADAGSCMTMTSFPGSCTPKAATCATNADCPTAWTCVDAPLTGTVSSPPARTDGGAPTPVAAGAPSPTGADGGTTAAPAVKMCMSPLGTTGVAKDGSETPVAVGTNGSAGGSGTQPTSGMQPPAEGAGNAASAPSAGCAVGGHTGEAPFAAVGLALLGLLIARRRR